MTKTYNLISGDNDAMRFAFSVEHRRCSATNVQTVEYRTLTMRVAGDAWTLVVQDWCQAW